MQLERKATKGVLCGAWLLYTNSILLLVQAKNASALTSPPVFFHWANGKCPKRPPKHMLSMVPQPSTVRVQPSLICP